MSREYQRKCIRVEAVQYVFKDSFRWLWDDCRITSGPYIDSMIGYGFQVLDTFSDQWRGFSLGDWILKGEHNEYYPMTDDAFQAQFIHVSDSDVIGQIIVERDRQFQLWGEQNPPPHSGGAVQHLGMSEEEAKKLVDDLMEGGSITWADIAFEEFAEALDAPTKNDRIGELVQLAAVIVSWIEAEMRNVEEV